MPAAMPFGSLWIPVVVSAVVVFVISSVLHMAFKYHRADYKQLPNEDAVREALGKGSLAPGLYQFPYCASSKEMQEPAHQAKFVQGPVGNIAIIANGAPAMGKYLGQWFLFTFVVSFITAYVARHALSFGADAGQVTRITGVVAFMGYGLTNVLDSIWKGQPWSNTVRSLIDGVIYAIATGATFCLLWPKG
jgi:hypothetical protein